MIRPAALLAAAALLPALARASLDAGAVAELASDRFDVKSAAVRKLARSADPGAIPVLQALSEGTLQAAAGQVFYVRGERAYDAASGAELRPAPSAGEPIAVNNRVRREVLAGLATLRLFSPDASARLAAAQEVATSADPSAAALLSTALGQERDSRVRDVLALALAQARLASPDPAARLDAAKILGGSALPAVKSALAARLDPAVEPDPGVRAAARASLDRIDLRLAVGELVGRVFSGLSLGSILLLAALGLAITFGVMGVINMAHGELLMIGAYATYAAEALFRRFLPGHVDWYLAAAAPLAFGVTALVGIAMERTVVRFLYGRPLETLLATWGVSLFLTQAVRAAFGAQNVQVSNPSWMSGGVEVLPNVVLPWNRIVIVAFGLAVLGLVWLFMRGTRLGLLVRAVTQNRAMSSCVGVRTGNVDMLAFGMGAGIAGLGGVALSQLANVGPDMGQGYIVDSFMAVVLGGVGQLAGAVLASFGVGVFSKFLEGWAGAVIAKILVLAFVIVVIQRRPQGLFAPKGRLVEG